MKKKILVTIMAVSMVASMMTGCGSKSETKTELPKTETEEVVENTEEVATENTEVEEVKETEAADGNAYEEFQALLNKPFAETVEKGNQFADDGEYFELKEMEFGENVDWDNLTVEMVESLDVNWKGYIEGVEKKDIEGFTYYNVYFNDAYREFITELFSDKLSAEDLNKSSSWLILVETPYADGSYVKEENGVKTTSVLVGYTDNVLLALQSLFKNV